jgi:poly-beta-1,6-N-acetyl-D-glucosamine synthase
MLLIGFCGILAAGYIGLMLNYWWAWRNLPKCSLDTDYQPITKISVVIAARNEAPNIGTCLQTIAAGDYPPDLYEVIVVDDDSTDDTRAVVREAGSRYFNVQTQLHVLGTSPEKSGKKAALALGIEQAQGDLIVCTDADCVLPSGWLRLHAWAHERVGAGVATAPVGLHSETNALQRFQSLDLLGLMAVTAAGIAQGWQRMANGANMSYPKRLYEALNGFAAHQKFASGDDMFMVQQAAARGERVVFIKHPDAIVLTDGPANWRDFFQQRLRWGAKNAALPEWRVKVVLAWVWLSCFVLLILPFSFFWGGPGIAKAWLLLMTTKFFSDWLLLREVAIFFDRRDLLRTYFASAVIHIFYVAVVGTASMMRLRFRWKDRRIK